MCVCLWVCLILKEIYLIQTIILQPKKKSSKNHEDFQVGSRNILSLSLIKWKKYLDDQQDWWLASSKLRKCKKDQGWNNKNSKKTNWNTIIIINKFRIRIATKFSKKKGKNIFKSYQKH